MRKLINAPADFADETVKSLLRSHDELTTVDDDCRVVVRSDRQEGRVGILTGGGSGHLPLFVGYVGEGLCGGAVIGNVFSSPSSDQVFAATRALDAGAGVLYIYGNYGGDILNFDLGADLAELEDIEVRTVVVHDDVLSAPSDRADSRRGVAGLALVYKCAGAAAERGAELVDVARVAEKASANVLSAGVGLAPTILPTTGEPSFTLEDGEMEVGIGIHGEPGRERKKIASAKEVALELVAPIVTELGLGAGDRTALLVNGLGATPLEELYLVADAVRERFSALGVTIVRQWVGEYATSLEMAGASITVMRTDDELEQLLNAPASSPLVRL